MRSRGGTTRSGSRRQTLPTWKSRAPSCAGSGTTSCAARSRSSLRRSSTPGWPSKRSSTTRPMGHQGSDSMAVTHAHGEVHTEHELTWIQKYIFSQDHKIIGIQYMITSLIMALIGGVLAMLIRMQLGWPGAKWGLAAALFPGGFQGGQMKPDFYLAVVTMHGTIMVFFVLTTILSGGFGNFLIPLQIGARDMAFPWLNMMSYWLVVPAIVVLVASFFVAGGAAGGGWTSYPQLSAIASAGPGSGLGQTLWLVALAILIVALLFGS